MKLKLLPASLLLSVYCGIGAHAQEIKSEVQLTTIKAPWVLRIEGQELDLTGAKVKPDEKSAYFMMTHEAAYLNVSVYIEPVDKCSTAEACRDHILGLGNPEWGKYQDLKKGTLGDASYFEFFLPEHQGQPIKMQHIYAQFVRDGYWVDMHISKVLYDPKKDRPMIENVVKAATFEAKGAMKDSSITKLASTGDAAAASWLALWDKRQCAASYKAMSSVTSRDLTEKGWVEHCTKLNDLLGANRSRNLIGSAFTSSLPPKTDRPVAVLAYQSNFAKHSNIVELVALMLEKDGRWTVTNYLPQ